MQNLIFDIYLLIIDFTDLSLKKRCSRITLLNNILEFHLSSIKILEQVVFSFEKEDNFMAT